MIALRRLGLETAALDRGSVIQSTRTFFPHGKAFGRMDIAALGRKVGASSICLHRAALQRILLDAARVVHPASVETGRECVGFEADKAGIFALFADGSQERGDLLIGADGVHSVIRRQLFGDENLRFAGYVAWRGVAGVAINPPLDREPLIVLGRGSQGGCFCCGHWRVYWYLTSNCRPGLTAGPLGNHAEVNERIKGWHVPFRCFVEATPEEAILRNDIVDRPARRIWGVGRVSLLGDAIHAMTPDLGQGACQALEDAVILADSLRRYPSAEAGLRDYEARRRHRANFVAAQSRQMSQVLQLSHPIPVWLRDTLGKTSWATNRAVKLFERLFLSELPVLAS